MTSYKKHHRRYPDEPWDYKAISTRVGNKEVVYYTLKTQRKGEAKIKEGVEIYQGHNYDVSSMGRSYSQSYNIYNLPPKYFKIVAELKRRYKATRWSKKSRVDLN
jgi:hypothetical protein